MRSSVLGALSAASLAAGISFDDGVSYLVHCDESSRSCGLHRQTNTSDGVISHASGTFADDVNADGWGKLWVHGDATNNGWYQSGFVEGALTAKRIYQHYSSWYYYQFGTGKPTEETVQFLLDQYDYSNELVRKNPNDKYYERLGNVMTQFHGILDGLNYAAEEGESLAMLDLLLLEAAGDLYDIIPAVNPAEFKLKVGVLSHQDFFDEWHRATSCSAMIKMATDLSDVYAGHTTWTNYQNMLRIYKNYDLGGGKYQSSHSSKPGVIYSKDDFYVLPNKNLVVMETTNGVINKDLYAFVTPKSLLTWQRIPMSNSLADSGKIWTDVMAQHNSGTYANQWMVVDMKLFTPGVGVAEKDFLWILELAPGVTAASDVTSTFIKQEGFWPSFNIPFQKDVYVVTGFQDAYETYGDQYSYENCPRSQIFFRDQDGVQNLTGIQKELRLNQFETDPLSAGDPTNAISSRKDLKSSGPSPTGGVDTKVTSFSRVSGGLSEAQCGPTHDDQPVFQWTGSPWENNTVHLGQPDIFNFNFVTMNFFQN